MTITRESTNHHVFIALAVAKQAKLQAIKEELTLSALVRKALIQYLPATMEP